MQRGRAVAAIFCEMQAKGFPLASLTQPKKNINQHNSITLNKKDNVWKIRRHDGQASRNEAKS
jgi:hypothetical protein